MERKNTRNEEIEEFRDKTLPFYKKMAVEVKEKEKNIINPIKRKSLLKRQLTILSNILQHQGDSIDRLKKIIDIKAEEINSLKERVKIFNNIIEKE